MSTSAPRVDTLRRMPARAPDRSPLRAPGGRPPQPRAASAGSGSASSRSLRACSSSGVRIARRIPMGRGSERCIGMRTAGGDGLVRGRAVSADGIPIRFERRSAEARGAFPTAASAGILLLGALPTRKRCGWESPPMARYQAPRPGSRRAIRLSPSLGAAESREGRQRLRGLPKAKRGAAKPHP